MAASVFGASRLTLARSAFLTHWDEVNCVSAWWRREAQSHGSCCARPPRRACRTPGCQTILGAVGTPVETFMDEAALQHEKGPVVQGWGSEQWAVVKQLSLYFSRIG